jgi:hypothetical protein
MNAMAELQKKVMTLSTMRKPDGASLSTEGSREDRVSHATAAQGSPSKKPEVLFRTALYHAMVVTRSTENAQTNLESKQPKMQDYRENIV